MATKSKPGNRTRSSPNSPIDDQPPRRKAILAAAYAVLMEQGYAGASTLEIASRAKLSKRELYAEFGSKSGILEALIAATAQRMQLALVPVELVDPEAFAAALTRYGVTALSELTHPAVLAINRLAVAEARASPELGRILDQKGREPNRKALVLLFSRAQAKGFVGDGDPKQMSGVFFSLLFGDLMLRLMLGVIAPPKPHEIERRAAHAIEAVLVLFARRP